MPFPQCETDPFLLFHRSARRHEVFSTHTQIDLDAWNRAGRLDQCHKRHPVVGSLSDGLIKEMTPEIHRSMPFSALNRSWR